MIWIHLPEKSKHFTWRPLRNNVATRGQCRFMCKNQTHLLLLCHIDVLELTHQESIFWTFVFKQHTYSMTAPQNYSHLDKTGYAELKPFTRFTRCRCHCRVAPAVAVRVVFPPAPSGFAPGRRPIINADRRRCRFPPRALRFCVGAGYLSPTWRTHRQSIKWLPCSEINQIWCFWILQPCSVKSTNRWRSL